MGNLWSSNTPAAFWLCDPNPSDEVWEAAILSALPILDLPKTPKSIDEMLMLTLGEKQFGENPWSMSRVKNLYYDLKPLMPLALRRAMRRRLVIEKKLDFQLGWPVEPRYAQFQWEVMRRILMISGLDSLSFRYFWPERHQFAFTLTHDIETAEGQAYVREVADWEESLGFRSSFAFVPENYPLDYELMEELRERGFEVAVHGLKHDGKDFKSYEEFMTRAPRINQALHKLSAKGFYAALTLRQPEWMQELEMEYDRSFFDTDPYEPNAGGVMSIWPFQIGRFLELPYTLPQDYTLGVLMQQSDPRIWREKTRFIQHYHGMALMVTHPDYLKSPHIGQMYRDFLKHMRDMGGDFWHALPGEVAGWWRFRSEQDTRLGTLVLENNCLMIYPD